MTRCAIYARVSTRDRQEVENQLSQLRRYAKAQRWQAQEYIDRESAGNADRDQFQAIFRAASRREFDVVLVWALDRFSREGVFQTFAHLEKLRSYGVAFESLTETDFRTTGPTGELLTAIYAWIAKQERLRIGERVNAGIARAREHGTRSGNSIGRPRAVFDRLQLIELRNAGRSWRQIAKELSISTATVRRVFQSGCVKTLVARGGNQ
jgi:DNA invertase Pin-like site-specific DNA recombinase